MPLEIRELVIKVTVDANQQQGGVNKTNLQDLKEQVIKECTNKILAKIKAQTER